MRDAQAHDSEYVVEDTAGPRAGIIERRSLNDGGVDERIGAIAAVEGLDPRADALGSLPESSVLRGNLRAFASA